ncbi:MAG: menaquinol oxidoreductase [Deltaproteobacteria bacterium]|nr:MAG: menaquinol oxidoreductase [Deltaproteobacteria bacterium]
MLEKALQGSRRYWMWIAFLALVILAGFAAYLYQLREGLGVTGLSRDVSWGLYIAQLTFLVGVAASAVMVVLPYYLHNFKAFGKLTILGEFLAIPSVIMCMLFVFVDMGQPQRVLNVLLHPTPNSPMFWDVMVLSGYLLLNILISLVTFGAERRGVAPPRWIRPIIILSIPWAISIHTVTAFLYAGLEARPFWMTAIMAPRFLASAFAAGPSLLILLCLLVRRVSRFDPGREGIQKVAVIVTYAMAANIFFVLVELFTGIYSDMPEHLHYFQYLFLGLEGHHALVPWAWTSQLLGVAALVAMFFPQVRRNEKTLALACLAIFAALWMEKGLTLIIAGFVPNPLGEVTEYSPTLVELLITFGIYAIGALVLSGLYKIAITVRESLKAA